MKMDLKKNEGVTLVEIMFVLIILALGILPIAAIQAQSHRDIYESGQRTEALSIAQLQMERARNMGFTAVTADSGAVGAFDWRTQVVPQSPSLAAVVVTVQWPEGDDTQTIQIRNLLSSR